MGRRWAAVLALAAFGLVGCSSDSESTPEASAASASASLAAVQAPAAADALSTLETEPQTVPAQGSGITPEQASQLFPEGTVVAPEQESWSPDGTGTGGVMRVTVTPPGGVPVTYLSVMVLEDGEWKVLATIPEGSDDSTETPAP